MASYYDFKKMFEKFSREAGKKQYLIPYFIAAHPGTKDEDMVNMALWLKKNNFEVDQVQTFYPSPMSLATAMYVSERNPLKKLTYKSGKIAIPRGLEQRRLHKALLRYHDSAGWPVIREALIKMRKGHLIGSAASALIPAEDPKAARSPNPNARKATPNARVQSKAAPQKAFETQATAKKPAAKAFGDKFESAKKFNTELKPKIGNPPKNNNSKSSKAGSFSTPKSKR